MPDIDQTRAVDEREEAAEGGFDGAARYGEDAPDPERVGSPEEVYVERFDGYSRFLHVLVITSFLALALTGMIIKFSEVSAFQFLAALLGGYEVTGAIHRLAAIVFALLVWLVLKLIGLLVATLRFLNGDDTALSRYFSRRTERKGFEALADGMLALAAGEGREAMAKAARVRPVREGTL